MVEVKVSIDSINAAYQCYCDLISDEKLCEDNQVILCLFSAQIDAYALATILNFLDNNPETSQEQQANLLIIRLGCMVVYEEMKYLEAQNLFHLSDYEKSDSYDSILKIRHKIHQFRKEQFSGNIKEIDGKMGRTRDWLNPCLDICLLYKKDNQGTELQGTNIIQYHFREATDKVMVGFINRIIRIIEEQAPYPLADFKIQRKKVKVKYKWQTYSYTSIMKNSKINNARVLDRVLFAFDDLCMIREFFDVTICLDEYLKTAPYLIYYFSKMVAIFLDETVDNLKSYIMRSDDSDAGILNTIIEGIDEGLLHKCKILRNNLHYEKQESVNLGDENEIYKFLLQELEVVEVLVDKIRVVLNINPSEYKLIFYNFLLWVYKLK